MADPGRARRYSFGVFELDGATGELRKHGIRIKLNIQPFQLLLMLLERPGEVLTRDEIAGELWPGGTFVDFEHGVNSAINRIREALGDQAKNPRFVETLPRRGYRFLAPVQQVSGEATQEIAAAPTAEATSYTGFLATPNDFPPTPRTTVRTLFILLQVMYLGYYTGALANLAEIEELFSPLAHATEALMVLIVTAALLIPVRVFLLSAAILHAPGFRGKFLKVWPFLLPFDILWALSPFLLLHHMSVGLALACMTPLVYAPFAQRSLILMGAGDAPPTSV